MSCDPVKMAQDMQAQNVGKSSARRVLREVIPRPVSKVMLRWPDGVRACPSAFLRCALFGVVQKGRRGRQVIDTTISAQGGLTVRVSGEELDQDDCDVWLALLHLARGKTTEHKIVISANEMVRLTGRTPSSGNRRVLNQRLRRLSRVSLDITEERGIDYTGHLVAEVLGGSDRKEYVITLPPLLFGLFQDGRYTSLEVAERTALSTHLARWLHGYFASHRKPYPVRLETIMRLCGSASQSLPAFESQLRCELREVARVTGCTYQIRKGVLHWRRPVRVGQITPEGTGVQE